MDELYGFKSNIVEKLSLNSIFYQSPKHSESFRLEFSDAPQLVKLYLIERPVRDATAIKKIH